MTCPVCRHTVTGIDVIIGGHSHDVVAPLTVTNAGGKTLIAQAGAYGALLGQVTLSVAPNGAVSLVEETWLPQAVGAVCGEHPGLEIRTREVEYSWP